MLLYKYLFDASFGCFFKFCRVKLYLTDLFVSGNAIVQVLEIFIHNGLYLSELFSPKESNAS